MKAKPVSLSANCLEEPGLTLTCAEQALHLITDCPEETSALNINCFGEKPVAVAAGCIEKPTLSIGCVEKPALSIGCVEKPVLSIACLEKPAVSICCRGKPVVSIDSGDYTLHNTEKQRLKFQSFKKFQAENISQADTQKSRIDHTVLGFPNIGNTCYMNATLQSLFSLLTFTQDIKREESCWRPNLTTHLLKCLADLHSARASRSSELKICLLKTLKRSIASNFSDFWGDEQQDAHEFFSILLSQLKEEGVSLRTRMGLHSFTCAIEANFEFELLSTRKCLSCGTKVCNTESYNCLSVDLVPGGSVQDCLALYFKGYEVECRCQWCCGELASVEQTLQSVPRVLVVQLKRFSFNSRGHLVKLHDRLHISPQLSLQAHSRANVRLPGMPKTHQTHGDCLDTSPSPGGAVCFTGHYICESTDGNTNWLSFDDERVKQMDQRSVLRQRANSAYLLFYEYRGAGGER
ncbi:hypothetical protein ANANG_G00284350 [Anguilla anguilla]|uniref:USP domain-containing protein n=1 Tax=Anguilla anguilla TaxID=7936 RepID=A0A9D3RIV0_ANGAN|nr:hypothetical protein ANANG_G00284350 [Anguilla anguilla]